MQTNALIATLTGHRDDPGYQATPDDELRAYTILAVGLEELGPHIAGHTKSPAAAAYFTLLAERIHRSAGYAQLCAADLARRTLVNELPAETLLEINDCFGDSAGMIEGSRQIPADPKNVPQGRATFKDTIEYLQQTFHLSFFEARNRLMACTHFFPHQDIHGVQQPPMFPLLADALATGAASPAQLAWAAQKLERLEPEIKQFKNQQELASQFESQIAQSICEDDPRTTSKLFTFIKTSLAKGTHEPSEEVLRSKTGLFYRGTKDGIAEFTLRTRAIDAEVLLSICAQMDNPRTNAGDREALVRQATNIVVDSSTVRDTQTAPAQTDAQDGSNVPAEDGITPTLPGIPDFLIDTTTGRPFTDADAANKLAMDRIPNEANLLELMNNTRFGSDGLTPPQRHLQGLLNLLKTKGRSPTGTKPKGLPSPKVFVVTTLAELEGKAIQSGLSMHGQNLTIAELRHALCSGGAIPITLDGKSQILDLGREQRFFPDYMREAIMAIYGGCIYPGCTVPAEHCEIDHEDEWANQGATRINDGCPLCSGHHHARHDGGLSIVRDADGLFSVVLPKHVDPLQKPRRNTYWRQFGFSQPLF